MIGEICINFRTIHMQIADSFIYSVTNSHEIVRITLLREREKNVQNGNETELLIDFYFQVSTTWKGTHEE